MATDVDVHLGVRVHVSNELLVVAELGVDLLLGVVAEVIAQGHQQHGRAEQLGLLAILVGQDLRPGNSTATGINTLPHSQGEPRTLTLWRRCCW